MSRALLFVRSSLFLLIMVLVTLIWTPVCLLVAPLPYRQRYWVTQRWNLFIVWLGKVLCGMRYEIRGLENLPDAPAILLSKHQSAWETIFFLWFMPRPLVYVFKRELLFIPFFGWALGLLRMVPINRSKSRDAFAQVVAQGRRRLADGLWIIMFPEGTRAMPGKKGKYKIGGARLALETNTLIVPIAMNSGDCWPKNSFITISIGKAIPPAGREAQDLIQEVEKWIESEMRVISPHAYR
jgi:1-acyl-sn-glycerol-3-phosphate acyltransferase